jgi:hypothetical protein
MLDGDVPGVRVLHGVPHGNEAALMTDAPYSDKEKIERLRVAIQTIHSLAALRSPNTDNPITTMMRIAEYCYQITNETRGWDK